MHKRKHYYPDSDSNPNPDPNLDPDELNSELDTEFNGVVDPLIRRDMQQDRKFKIDGKRIQQKKKKRKFMKLKTKKKIRDRFKDR